MTKKEYLESTDRCELCGSPKKLEIHHIIPLCVNGIDTIDNWIAICSSCHSKLTPKSLLIKQGVDRAVIFDSLNSIYSELYEQLGVEMEDGGCPCVVDVLDMFDEIYAKYCKKIWDRLENSHCKKKKYKGIWENILEKLGGELY